MAKLILKAPYYKRGHKTEDGRGRGGYAEYIATREGVELLRGGMVNYIGQRKGSCGLFSDEGVTVDLAKVSQEIDNHSGNVWALIFSLKREDAERLGYNSAAQWVNLLRSRRNDIAKAMHIAPENLRWYAAYHNKETNPHAHMMVWSQKSARAVSLAGGDSRHQKGDGIGHFPSGATLGLSRANAGAGRSERDISRKDAGADRTNSCRRE